jgi:hypothetical protein
METRCSDYGENEMSKHIQAYPVGFDQDPGMTLRDYFAAKAMQSYVDERLLLNSFTHEDAELIIENCANLAYRMADAMLRAREA